MESARLHPEEEERLAALYRYEVLDSESEKTFDELTELASSICGTPISLISLVDANRQWFKSKVGLDASETDRSLAFCSHAILQDQVFEIPNALEDERFADNPLVTRSPDIRFYAGAPLYTAEGLPLGTLCVIDTVPRNLSDDQRRALEVLANQVIGQLELRLRNRKLAKLNKTQAQVFSLLAHDLSTPFNGVLGITKILAKKAQSLAPHKIAEFAHGVLTSSQQIYQLLEELLQWSQHQWIDNKSEFTVFQLAEVASECTDFFKQQLRHKNLNVRVVIEPSMALQSDRHILKTVLRNLLGNAIKYSHDNSTISIVAEQVGSEVHIAVDNDGEMMTPELKKRLFKEQVLSEPGVQIEKGHGLGLMLCHDFLQGIKGNIWVDKDFDKGTRIVVSLPSTNL